MSISANRQGFKIGPGHQVATVSPNSNRATNVPVTIDHAGGSTTVKINQQQHPPHDKLFISLGVFEFTEDKPARVIISNAETDGHVIADAV